MGIYLCGLYMRSHKVTKMEIVRYLDRMHMLSKFNLIYIHVHFVGVSECVGNILA